MGWERWRWRATTNLGRAANRAVRDCLRRVPSRGGRDEARPSRGGRDEARPSRGGRHQVVTEGSDCVQRVVYGMGAMALARDHEYACFAGYTNWKWRSSELVSGGVVPPVPLSFNDSAAGFCNAHSSDAENRAFVHKSPVAPCAAGRISEIHRSTF